MLARSRDKLLLKRVQLQVHRLGFSGVTVLQFEDLLLSRREVLL